VNKYRNNSPPYKRRQAPAAKCSGRSPENNRRSHSPGYRSGGLSPKRSNSPGYMCGGLSPKRSNSPGYRCIDLNIKRSRSSSPASRCNWPSRQNKGRGRPGKTYFTILAKKQFEFLATQNE
jgi:hypothetical protein